MHRPLLFAAVTLALLVAVPGCARKSSTTAAGTSSDSLFTSNPTERSLGDITPQPAPEPPAARAPRARPARVAAPAPPPVAAAPPERAPAAAPHTPTGPPMNVRWGTALRVTFGQEISSKTAQAGDAWSGTLRDSVVVDNGVAFPAGSIVHGTVKDAKPAQKGDRAMLTLEVGSIEAYGQTWPAKATADPIIADSPRARNLGSILGGAAAGALIGGAIGGGKGGLIGGAVGGAAATGVVAASEGPQVVVKPGASLLFNVAWDVVVRK